VTPIETSRRLSRAVSKLAFGAPVAHVYNPLDYARAVHERYLRRYARPGIDALLLGMNPGPHGMVQTGVPFGEITLARTWLDLSGKIARPEHEHPARPIEGFACRRSEVSGARLWGWARDRFGTPERFFRRFFVWNYCPLAFLEESGRNRTPDKLSERERTPLFASCDEALRRITLHLEPTWVVGIGAFATDRAQRAFTGTPMRIGSIPHPSPASPAANRGWAPLAERALGELGLLE
jgi:single-strand selective monofunctional uracil DNA glycosylase